MKSVEVYKNGFAVSTDKARLNIRYLHGFLSGESHWSKNIPLEVVQKSIENSLCFGVYQKEKQVGFARVISDFATIAYLGDVFIDSNFRGLGLSKWLMEAIL